MRARYGLLAVVAISLLCSGWWLYDAARPPAKDNGAMTSRHAPASPTATPLTHHTVAPSTAPPFATAPADLSRVARTFVTAATAYDARTDRRLGFLARARAFTAPGELRRLATSPRAELPWEVLRGRAERVRTDVVGVSTVTRQAGAACELIVEAITTPRTDFATVRSMEQVTLTMTRTRAGWRVADATGAGL
jgi:hypothetical protein